MSNHFTIFFKAVYFYGIKGNIIVIIEHDVAIFLKHLASICWLSAEMEFSSRASKQEFNFLIGGYFVPPGGFPKLNIII